MTTREFIEKELAGIEADKESGEFLKCAKKLTDVMKALGHVIFVNEVKAQKLIAGSFFLAAKTAFGVVLEHIESEVPK